MAPSFRLDWLAVEHGHGPLLRLKDLNLRAVPQSHRCYLEGSDA